MLHNQKHHVSSAQCHCCRPNSPYTPNIKKHAMISRLCHNARRNISTYKASDMILAIHSGASYLSEPKSQMQSGGAFFLSSNIITIHNVMKVIRAVMSSAAKIELGAMFFNALKAKAIQATLTEMRHLQPHMSIQPDSSTTKGIIINTILPKATLHELPVIISSYTLMRCHDCNKICSYTFRLKSNNEPVIFVILVEAKTTVNLKIPTEEACELFLMFLHRNKASLIK